MSNARISVFTCRNKKEKENEKKNQLFSVCNIQEVLSHFVEGVIKVILLNAVDKSICMPEKRPMSPRLFESAEMVQCNSCIQMTHCLSGGALNIYI